MVILILVAAGLRQCGVSGATERKQEDTEECFSDMEVLPGGASGRRSFINEYADSETEGLEWDPRVGYAS